MDELIIEQPPQSQTKFFKNKNEFSLYLEDIKIKHKFDGYIETILYFYENESDHEIKEIVRMLNKKIIDSVRHEAESTGMIKLDTNSIDLSSLL